MRYSYNLDPTKGFETRLRMLAKRNKKIELNSIKLKLINIDSESEICCSIPIERVNVSKEGEIVCETIVERGKLHHSMYDLDEPDDEIFFEKISVSAQLGEGEIEVAFLEIDDDHDEEDKFEIDLDHPITIIAINFVTSYPQAIRKKYPKDIGRNIIYDRYSDDFDGHGKDKNQPKPKEIIFFTGKNFTGDSHKYKVGDVIDFPWFKGLDNQLNSVRIGSHCKVMVWIHTFEGVHKLLLEDTPDIDIGD